MNAPNILTIFRIIMTAGFIALFRDNIVAAAGLFVLASVTDYFDGSLARKYDCVTSFGKIMDPVADKFLILSAFGMFALIDMVPWWIFWVIAVREVAVTLFRFWVMAKGSVLAAEQAGKAKTVFQIAAVILMLVFRILYFYEGDAMYRTPLSLFLGVGIFVLLWFSVIITLMSGVAVFWNNRTIGLGSIKE